MPRKKHIISREELKKVLGEQEDFLRPLVQKLVQEVLEAEMEEREHRGGKRRANSGTIGL